MLPRKETQAALRHTLESAPQAQCAHCLWLNGVWMRGLALSISFSEQMTSEGVTNETEVPNTWTTEQESEQHLYCNKLPSINTACAALVATTF